MTRPRTELVGDLRSALIECADDIATQIDRIRLNARAIDADPYQLRTPHGDYVLAPLLAARAQTLAALTALEVRP